MDSKLAQQLQHLSIEPSTEPSHLAVPRSQSASTSPSCSSSFTDASAAHSISTAASTPLPSDDECPSSHCEVRSTPDRGQALFATRRIRPGTLIFTEDPLIALSKDLEESPEAIEAAFSALSRRDKKTYLSLFDSQKSRMSAVVSIYYSNCYSTESFVDATTTTTSNSSSSATNGSCIGALSSRINHSCVPNVSFSFLGASPAHPRGQVRFYAVRAVARGKELLSNYDKGIFETAARRQQKYVMHYGFRCACEACVPATEFWAKSDERRKAMRGVVAEVKALEREWMKGGRREGGGDRDRKVAGEAVAALRTLEGLLVKEGLVAMPLANAYRSLAKWAERGGQDAGLWKEKELEVSELVFGKRAPRSAALRAELEGRVGHVQALFGRAAK